MVLLFINGGSDPARPDHPGGPVAITILLIGAGLANSFIYITVSFIRLNIYSARIEEAIAIMNDAENVNANIPSIAFRSGFNSKSTFNSVFKKITGKTPSEYRNSIRACNGSQN